MCIRDSSKDLVFWKFHWDNTVLLQTSSKSDVLSLPLVTARSAFFFDHLFKFESTKGELYFQLGAEAMIHTTYYAMNYMPATGRYFSQSDTEIGNYPVSYTHLRAHETGRNLVCRLLLEKKKKNNI